MGRRIHHMLRSLAAELIYSLFKIFPVEPRKIVFMSYWGKSISCNPKYLYLEFVRQGLDASYEIIWFYTGAPGHSLPGHHRIVRSPIVLLYHLATAGIWVDNCRRMGSLQPRLNTTYIQLWHGTPMKRIEFDTHDVPPEYHPNAIKDSANISLLLLYNSFCREVLPRAFRYQGPTLLAGTPRCDLFYSDDREALRAEIRERLHLHDDLPVVLYAPTFRSRPDWMVNFPLDIEGQHLITSKMKAKCHWLMRLHIAATGSLGPLAGPTFMDVSGYPDMQELLLITDLLITDYSSAVYDFLHLDRPIILFPYDEQEYKNKSRGFYIDYPEDLPYPAAYSTESLISFVDAALKEWNPTREYESFKERYCTPKGNSSNRVIEWINNQQLQHD